MGPTFFGKFFCQEYGKNIAAAKKNSVFFKPTKTRFTVLIAGLGTNWFKKLGLPT